uniref:Uncharacterized protein n=1 Tax=Hot spring virus BHS1 TaxID=2024351 RepID=A0A2U7P6D3_9VIRU|nr:hypothetical protein [Hot spring virus BHS1]
MSAEIKLEGQEKLLARLESLGRLDMVKAGIQAAAVYLKGKLSQYPPSRRLTRAEVYGQTFQTDRQRRGFFAKLRSGEIEVPYRRGESPKSQRFKAGWTIAAQNSGMTVVIGNDTEYGPLLMEKEMQSLYAKRVGWRTIDAVVDDERPEVLRIVKDSIDSALED